MCSWSPDPRWADAGNRPGGVRRPAGRVVPAHRQARRPSPTPPHARPATADCRPDPAARRRATWLRRPAPGTARGRPVGPVGPRHAVHHVDRFGEVGDLPVGRLAARGPDRGRLAVDRPAARPGGGSLRAADRRGGGAQLDPERQRARADAGRRRAGEAALSPARPRAAGQGGGPERPAPRAPAPVRRRRGALRVGMGPRLSPRLPLAELGRRGRRSTDRSGPDRDRGATRTRGHHQRPGHAHARGDRARV